MNQRGSIAVESAVLFPIFLMIFMVFALIIRVSLATMNLKHIALVNADHYSCSPESLTDIVLLRVNAKRQWVSGEGKLWLTGPNREGGEVSVVAGTTLSNTIPFMNLAPLKISQRAVSLDWRSSQTDEVLGSGSVWDLSPMARGSAIQKHFGRNLPQFFPTICKLEGGQALSIVSFDVTLKTYQEAGGLSAEILEAAQKLADFRGGEEDGVAVNGQDIKSKELWVVIPAGAVSAAQENEIADAIASAKKYAFDIKLIEYQTKGGS